VRERLILSRSSVGSLASFCRRFMSAGKSALDILAVEAVERAVLVAAKRVTGVVSVVFLHRRACSDCQ